MKIFASSLVVLMGLASAAQPALAQAAGPDHAAARASIQEAVAGGDMVRRRTGCTTGSSQSAAGRTPAC